MEGALIASLLHLRLHLMHLFLHLRT